MKKTILKFSVLLFLQLCASSFLFAQETLIKDFSIQPKGISNDVHDQTQRFCTCGSNSFFTAEDNLGLELWVTDGTAGGTKMLKDITSGSEDSWISLITCINEAQVYFFESHSSQWWVSDGTELGTKKIGPLPLRSYSRAVAHAVDNAFYLLDDPNDGLGLEIWLTDGTASGTDSLGNIPTTGFTVVWDVVSTSDDFFISTLNLDSARFEIWSVNEQKVVTKLDESFLLSRFGKLNDWIYYTKGDHEWTTALYKTDGTFENTTLVTDFPGEGFYYYNFNGKLIVSSRTETRITDGTTGGTQLLANYGFNAFAVVDNDFYGFGSSYADDSYVIMKTNGTDVSLKSYPGVGIMTNYNTAPLPVVNGQVVFQFFDEQYGAELGITNESEPMYSVLKDINSGLVGSSPKSFTQLNNKALFLADDGQHGTELWISDGTPSGTLLMKEIATGNESSFGEWISLIATDDQLFVLASTEGSVPFSRDIFSLHNRDESPKLLKDFPSWGNPRITGRIGNQVIFCEGTEIFRSEHTTDELTSYKILPNVSFGYANRMYPTVNGKVIFAVSSLGEPWDFGEEFWVTNGTEDGTHVLKDIYPGSTSGINGISIVAGDRLFFAGEDVEHGSELWVSDGTQEGTKLVTDLYAGAGGSYPADLTAFNDKLIFSAISDLGRELWVTDGTSQGTNLIKDIMPRS